MNNNGQPQLTWPDMAKSIYGKYIQPTVDGIYSKGELFPNRPKSIQEAKNKYLEVDKKLYGLTNEIVQKRSVDELTPENRELYDQLTNIAMGAVNSPVSKVSPLMSAEEQAVRSMGTKAPKSNVANAGLYDAKPITSNSSQEEIMADLYRKAGIKQPEIQKIVKNNDIPFTQKAIKEYGTTNVPESAAFVTPEGKIIDSSGRKQGSMSEGRNIDHREIAVNSVPDNATTNGMSGSDALSYFMKESGSTRVSVMPNEINIDTLNPLTDVQLKQLKKLAKGKSIVADISRPDGSVAKSGVFKTFDEYKTWIKSNLGESNVAQQPVTDAVNPKNVSVR